MSLSHFQFYFMCNNSVHPLHLLSIFHLLSLLLLLQCEWKFLIQQKIYGKKFFSILHNLPVSAKCIKKNETKKSARDIWSVIENVENHWQKRIFAIHLWFLCDIILRKSLSFSPFIFLHANEVPLSGEYTLFYNLQQKSGNITRSR